MTELFIQSIITLAAITSPFTVLPAFMALTSQDTLVVRNRIALKATIIAGVVLIIFSIIGDKILDFMSISEPAFRIAGGLLLLFAGLEMVTDNTIGFKGPSASDTAENPNKPDVSVFPLAIPLIAGPGALTTVMILMRQAQTMETIASVIVIVALFLTLSFVYLGLRFGHYLMNLLGSTGISVMSRVFGILIAAMATQHLIVGVTAVIKHGLS